VTADDSHHVALFHISEDPNIGEFIPRPSKYLDDPVVWAIDAVRVRNYLVPRDCPRVTFYASLDTTVADSDRFLGTSSAVVAVEASWWERIRSCRLYAYHLPPTTFTCIDECAGYYVSRERIRPVQVEPIDDPISLLLSQGVELRILQEIESLRRAVVESTLQFSIIRMCNASNEPR
jgi:hypothetical protein